MDFKDLQFGDSVHSILNGWGTYTSNDSIHYLVDFPDGFTKKYNVNGFFFEHDIKPEIIGVKRRHWQPKKTDDMYIINANGKIHNTKARDEKCLETGRIYHTYKQAKHVYEKTIKPCQRLASWISENDPNNIYDINWGDKTQGKYFIYYYYKNSEWLLNYTLEHQIVGVPYILCKKTAEKLVNGLNNKTIIL